MNISKITVGRLYNLGNYEHIRYDITVDVKEGESAATAIKGLEQIIAGLAPLKSKWIKSATELQRLAEEVEEMKAVSAVDWERRYGHIKGSSLEVIDRYQKSLEEETIKRQTAIARARSARKRFDDLGGAEQWKDAKLEWEDCSDEL